MATGTIVHKKRWHLGGAALIHSFEITADSSGNFATDAITVFNGFLHSVKTIPYGSNPPTVNWDLVVNDRNSYDILQGLGADRSDTAVEEIGPRENGVPKPYLMVEETFTLVGSNLGNANQVTVEVVFFSL